MPVHDDPTDFENGPVQEKFSPIKEDRGSFHEVKENVVNIVRDIKAASNGGAHVAAEYVRDRVGDLKTSGTRTLESVEDRIKSKPGQSVAVAFAVGIIASYLFGRRSS